MITLESGERGYICRECMRFVPESVTSGCDHGFTPRKECGKPYEGGICRQRERHAGRCQE